MCPNRFVRLRHLETRAFQDHLPLDAANVQPMSTGHRLVEPECRFSSGLSTQIKKPAQGGLFEFGAGSRNRTGTISLPLDFESSASTSSAIPA